MLYHRSDSSGLRGRFAQVLTPGRYVVEEVLHGNHRADRRARTLCVADFAAFNPNLGAKVVIGVAAEQRDLAHGGDAVERFAAKAKGADVVEIIGSGQLACGMAGKSQRQVCGRNAVPVVDDAQKTLAAFADLDTNLISAGVETVLNQFFGHVGRSLNDLAGGDFCSNIGCKLVNSHDPAL